MKMTQTRKLEEKVFSFMEEHEMLLPGERVVAGISGGADSVCLLFVLLEWKRRYGLELAVVHVNHGIRAEAGEDARFVEEMCRQQGIPFYLREADVPKLAAQQKCSEEEAGRNFRYQSFGEAANEFGAGKIAVAHNLNDRCETMLFHLFRGSGVKGLAGIPPFRRQGQQKIIRPLLNTDRGEIEAYLAEKGQSFCYDKTNEEDAYTRNRIRHYILPYVEEYIVSGCVQHMGQTAELLAETEDYLCIQTKAARRDCVKEKRTDQNISTDGKVEAGIEYILDCDMFGTLHPAIRKRILYELLQKLSPGAKDIAQAHVMELQDLLLRQGNRRIDLPFGISGYREYGKVCLGLKKQAENFRKTEEKSGRESMDVEACEDMQAEFQVLKIENLPKNQENFLIFPENKYTKWFDYDKMKKSPVFRTRAAGDYLLIGDGSGGMHHKKLKDYMVNEKIPPSEREKIPVLAEDSHVLWLVGYRISEYYKVTENTKQVLQVKCRFSGGM